MSEPSNKSFIENVNTIANATKLATGNVIEDAQLARDQAVAAADEAKLAETGANTSELKAKEWAQNAYNNPVQTNMFSSFHWSEVARLAVGDPIINDAITSIKYTWSSSKITQIANTKANKTHNHDGIYEKTFIKNSAFNMPFSGSGVSSTVARGDHNHDINYEPVVGAKGTAFNKNFGTNSGDVAEGDHIHPQFMETSVWTLNSMLSPAKIPWVADTQAPQADEVPRGTHTHNADLIPYDSTSNEVITSGTVQGALTQLDGKYSDLSIAKKTYITASMSTQHELPISGVNTPVKINIPLAVLSAQNASITNGAEFAIAYPIEETPIKFIEGTYSISIALSSAMTQDIALSMSVNGIIVGEQFSGTSRTLTLTKHLTALDNDGFTLAAWISNRTDTANVFIDSINMVWVGAPEGAIVSSGISVDHSDLTGTGAPNGVHTTSDIQDLDNQLGTKADKAPPATANNFAALDAVGNLIDSGVAKTVPETKMTKVSPATLDNIIVQTSTGEAKDGGKTILDLANVAGSTSQVFNVAAGSGTQAVNKSQLDDITATLATKVEFNNHEGNISIPHSVTPSQIGAAEQTHTHVQTQVVGLTDELNDKYAKVSGAATNNIPIFETGGLLKDSGVAYEDINPDLFVKSAGDSMSGNLNVPTINNGIPNTSIILNSNGNTTLWNKIISLDGISDVAGASVSLVIYNVGGYGHKERDTKSYQISERAGDLRVVCYNMTAGLPSNQRTELGYIKTGDNSFDVYVKREPYNAVSIDVKPSSLGTVNVFFNSGGLSSEPAGIAYETVYNVLTSNGGTLANSHYIGSKLSNGTSTRVFGINSSDQLHLGQIDNVTGLVYPRGAWNFPDALPISTKAPTASYQFVNKAYADTKLPIVGGVIKGILKIQTTQPTITFDETDSPNGWTFSWLMYQGNFQLNVRDDANNYKGSPFLVDIANGGVPQLKGTVAGWYINGDKIIDSGGGTIEGELTIASPTDTSLIIDPASGYSGNIVGIATDGTTAGWVIGRNGGSDNLTIHNYITDKNIRFLTTGAGRLTYNGEEVATVVTNEIKLYAGDPADLAFGWKVANGQNNTIDMSSQFMTVDSKEIVYIQYIGV